MAIDFQTAREIADNILASPSGYGIVDYAEAKDFWAFFGGHADGIVREGSSRIVVVMKSDGSVIQPMIPSKEGFALLSQLPAEED